MRGCVPVPSRVACVDRRVSLEVLDWTVYWALISALPPNAARRNLVVMLAILRFAFNVNAYFGLGEE
jgi:hypothetical protein